jgi:hypothetical protein
VPGLPRARRRATIMRREACALKTAIAAAGVRWTKSSVFTPMPINNKTDVTRQTVPPAEPSISPSSTPDAACDDSPPVPPFCDHGLVIACVG